MAIPDAGSEYFTDGMAEEIITALTKVEVLDVASRTSAFAFKDQSRDIRKIGRKLNVGTFSRAAFESPDRSCV